jgi:hypothetical protein
LNAACREVIALLEAQAEAKRRKEAEDKLHEERMRIELKRLKEKKELESVTNTSDESLEWSRSDDGEKKKKEKTATAVDAIERVDCEPSANLKRGDTEIFGVAEETLKRANGDGEGSAVLDREEFSKKKVKLVELPVEESAHVPVIATDVSYASPVAADLQEEQKQLHDGSDRS